MTWIIEFKGDLSDTSELNMDGSDSMRAVCLVKGTDLPTVLSNLLAYTQKRGITPTEIKTCQELSTFPPTEADGYTSQEIASGLQKLKHESLVVFTYAISSEAEADDDAIVKENRS